MNKSFQLVLCVAFSSLTTLLYSKTVQATTYSVDPNYQGSMCIEVPIQYARGTLNIRWGSWNASVDIPQGQASSRGPGYQPNAGMPPGVPSMLLTYVMTSYKGYQLLIDATRPAYIQFEAYGNNGNNLEVTGVPHNTMLGSCPSFGGSVIKL